MFHELTTLLPRDRRRALLREYLFRLATVAALGAAIAIIVHGILLVPVWFYLKHQATEQQLQLEHIAAESGGEEKAAAARLTKIESDAQYLARLDKTPTVSGLVRAIIQVPRPGITLTGFSFTPGSPNKLLVIGTADTRDALRNYDVALGALPFVSSADLPISAYAKETDIPFSITLSGSLTP